MACCQTCSRGSALGCQCRPPPGRWSRGGEPAPDARLRDRRLGDRRYRGWRSRHRARSIDEDHGRLAVRPSKTQDRSAEDACHDEAVDPSADEVIDQGQLRIRASPRAGDHGRPAVRIGRLCDGGHELDEERDGRVGKDEADHLSGAATQSLGVHVRSVVKLGDRLPNPCRSLGATLRGPPFMT
jgi:hypothetical protein